MVSFLGKKGYLKGEESRRSRGGGRRRGGAEEEGGVEEEPRRIGALKKLWRKKIFALKIN